MKTVGTYLRHARKQKNLTLRDVSFETKIRHEFLEAIEHEEWNKLPEFPVVAGFVKSIADAVGAERDQASALLRRDYPPKALPTTPKPDIPREFRLSPQLVFFMGVGLVILTIAGYLFSQYVAFTRPPSLRVDTPEENAVILESEIRVSGKSDPDTTIVVNTQPALVEDDGTFSTIIEISKESKVVEVTATSRAGKTTRVTRNIIAALEK